MVLAFKGFHSLLGRRQAEKPLVELCCPKACLGLLGPQGPGGLPAAQPTAYSPGAAPGITGPSMCPPGGALGEGMSPGVAVAIFGAR